MDNPYRPPSGEILTRNSENFGNPTTWAQILFKFKGRIPRRQFWAGTLLVLLAYVPGAVMLGFFEGEDFEPTNLNAIAGVFLMIFAVWVSVALSVKRWHDRDKSGWFYFVSWIPLIGGIWALIENGCLRGTEGPNRYGADPT